MLGLGLNTSNLERLKKRIVFFFTDFYFRIKDLQPFESKLPPCFSKFVSKHTDAAPSWSLQSKRMQNKRFFCVVCITDCSLYTFTVVLQEKGKVAQLRKTFEEEKAQIEESMNQQDPKEAEMAEELKQIQEEIESQKVSLF